MSANKIIKSVSFNKNNPNDERILKHVSRRNFSGYVKKLLLQDLEHLEAKKTQETPPIEVVEPVKEEIPRPTQEKRPQEPPKEKTAQRLERMRQQLNTNSPQVYSQPNLFQGRPKRK